MIRTLTLATTLAAAITLPAIAQDVKAPATAMQATSAERGAPLSLTSQEAQTWIGKPVFSSDGKKLGEIAAFERTADNKVTEMDANIGGFLGLGEHRIRLAPAQFNLQSDRVVLNLTAAQAKELPKVLN
jgi:hypothetical protein